MIGSVKIAGKAVAIRASVGALIRYKEQFGTDYFAELKAIEALQKANSPEADSKMFASGIRLVWAMSGSDTEHGLWAAGATREELKAASAKAVDIFMRSLGDGRESGDECSDDSVITIESLLACCIASGISASDAENKTVGTVLNTISAYVDIRTGEKKERVRTATQADTDAF